MSQEIFDSIDPATSGIELADILNDFKDAVVSGLSGTSRPAELEPGGFWVDTTNDPTSWTFNIWTGSDDVAVFTVDLVNGTSGVSEAADEFTITKISADTAGAILDLIKRRIASGGQVLSGDTIGEIRFTGRTDDSDDPVVGYIKWVATDNMTISESGGTFSFYSTPDGQATAIEHLRFINGLIETVVPHKMNSQILVGQNVATSATIAQLSADKVLVEMTGSTATDIQGIKSDDDSQVVTIHNRSSATVTIKHESGSASDNDRIKLPNGVDYSVGPEGTVSFFYCTADTRWKILATSDKVTGFTVDTLYGLTQTWTAPAGVTAIRARAYQKLKSAFNEKTGILDSFGNAYAWGLNANGQVGDSSVTPKSSPVAVGGSLTFEKYYGSTAAATAAYGITNLGAAYGWGINTNGQLGDSSVTPRSAPVAVAGSLRFNELYPRDASCYGLSTNGFAYAWGLNTNGQLGDSSVTPRSAPVAVTGGLRFAKLLPISGANSSSAVVGITTAGVGYAWGLNTNGNLGVGDVTPRSSPVAVLGGLTFQDVVGGALSSAYSFIGLNTAGAAYGWGGNAQGQLGVGDTTSRSSPVAVVGGLTFARLIMQEKSESVFGFTTGGSLYAWGYNDKGTLGVGDSLAKSSPIAVVGGLTFANIRPYRRSVFGLTADGTLYGWGDNANGQLGLGDVVARSSPVAVLGGLKFSDLFFADSINDQYSVIGITGSGQMYAWGANANGTLGLGDVTPRSSPVAVLGAFAAETREVVTTMDLTVVPGSNYTVSLGAGASSVGGEAIGRNIYKLEIEYIR